MNQKALCIVSRYAGIEWVNFLSKFKNYDVYIVVDDNSNDYSKIYSEFSNVKILQFEEKECEKYGFIGALKGMMPGSKGTLRGGPTENKRNAFAWDKAFYYFAKVNNSYEYVWFLEDDVFIYDETSLFKIDYQYSNQDLISGEFNQDFIEDDNLPYPNKWWWQTMYRLGNFKPEGIFYSCYAFHIRLSKKFIKKIEDYADKYKTLFYHEAFLPIICIQNNLSFAYPDEFRFSRPSLEIDKNTKKGILGSEKCYFFHPIKDLKEHECYRGLATDDLLV